MSKFDFQNQFKRDMKKQPFELFFSEEWNEVTNALMNGKAMKEKYCDHDLKGNWKGHRECHIKPDLLLIYKKRDDGIIQLVRIGSHSELYG
ncbi:MAG: type II toxin-antitoxin system YafQ family toxin [Neisseriaceae bacterium]|nr:type II toxin-antitoxin system YafQ family toxin [Neisseriaceae bacterium]MBR1819578.1 type II toxin-antitoxin system YafQ family toxin [Neisseriaceae bacterium]